MENDAFIVIEKENRQIVYFDVLKYSTIANDRSDRFYNLSLECQIRLSGVQGTELMDIFEFREGKYIKMDMEMLTFDKSFIWKGCFIREVQFNEYKTFDITLSIDYQEIGDPDSPLMISYRREQKLKSIGI